MLQAHVHYIDAAKAFVGWTLDALREHGGPLVARLLAIPEVLHADYRIDDVPLVDEDGSECDDGEIDVYDAIECKQSTVVEARMVCLRDHIVVGLTQYDDDAENPLTACEGMGRILEAESINERIAIRAAQGLNENDEFVIDEQQLLTAMAGPLWNRVASNLGLVLTLNRSLRESGSEHALRAAFDNAVTCGADATAFNSYFAGEESLPAEVLRTILDTATKVRATLRKKMRRDGEYGDPFAVPLDIYEHGGRVYSVSGEGTQDRWDTSRCAAMWFPDETARDSILSNVLEALKIGQVRYGARSEDGPSTIEISTDRVRWQGGYTTWRAAIDALVLQCGRRAAGKKWRDAVRQEAAKCARGVLEEYNEWLGGQCFGVCVYVIDRRTGERIEDEDDVCWGHIGSKYAEDTLDTQVFATVASLVEASRKKAEVPYALPLAA